MKKTFYKPIHFRLRRLRFLAESYLENGFTLLDRFNAYERDCYVMVLQKGKTTIQLEAGLHRIETFVNGELRAVQPYGKERVFSS